MNSSSDRTMRASTGRRFAALGAALLTALLALLLVPASGLAGKKIPPSNVVANPTFNQGAKGWDSLNARVVAIREKSAPDGKKVARVRQQDPAEGYTIDDRQTSAGPTVAGATYSGKAYVQGAPSSDGSTAELVLRETTPDGAFVGESVRGVKLDSDRFRKVKVTRSAAAEGNSIDVYVRMTAGDERSSFLVDAISLTTPRPDGGEQVPGGDGPVTTSQIAIITSQEDPLFTADGSRYRYIVIRDGMESRLEELRSAHPEAEILLYKDVSFTATDQCEYAPLQGTGVDYCEANSHESWFLHRKSNPSQRIASESYGSYRAMNVANAGYQQAWASTVLDRLSDAHADGSGAEYDGVWMDDTNLLPGHGMGGQIAELTDSQYREATVSFVNSVAPKLEAAGFKAVPNLAMEPWDNAQRSAAVSIASKVSSINREGFVRWGDAGELFTTDGGAPIWMDEVTLAEKTQAAGADLHAITYGSTGDARTQRYARATFLMAWDGSDGGALNFRTSETSKSWGANWTTDVGVPTAARKSVGKGFVRRFSNGIVAINPSSSGTQQFSLGGSYRNPDGGACVSTIELASARAAVMPAC